jgi:hypothetical protein
LRQHAQEGLERENGNQARAFDDSLSADSGIFHSMLLLLTLVCFLKPCCFCFCVQPNPESALNEEAGKLLLEDYEEYAKQARLMTQIHATKKLILPPAAPQDENAGKEAEEAKVERKCESFSPLTISLQAHGSKEGKNVCSCGGGGGGYQEEDAEAIVKIESTHHCLSRAPSFFLRNPRCHRRGGHVRRVELARIPGHGRQLAQEEAQVGRSRSRKRGLLFFVKTKQKRNRKR